MTTALQKKIQTPILAIILLSLLFNFAAAPITALAQHTPQHTATAPQTSTKTASPNTATLDQIGTIGKAFLWGFNGLLAVFVVTLDRFTAFAGNLFDAAIIFSIDSNLKQFGAITAGWTISRDVANIFFVLFILIIAIATILGVQNYGAKSLLARLIMVAILVNFSLPMGLVIIDATNILGLQFYDKIKEGGGSPSAAILAGTKLQNVFNTNAPADSSQAWKDKAKDIGRGVVTGIGAAAGIALCLATAAATAGFSCGYIAFLSSIAAGGAIGASIGWGALKGDFGFSDAAEFFYLEFAALVFLLPLLFVFVFGAALVLIRSIILILLLVLAPIAFVSYVLPITEKKLWQPWWETFLNHAFFLPAFMFLLYFSLSFINQVNKDVSSGTTAVSPELMLLALTSALLLSASLILARKMGIYFADSVLAYSTLAKKWVTGAVGGFALRNTVGRLGGVMQKSEAIQSSVFGKRISEAMARAGARLPGGSYEDLQKDKAKLAMQKAEGEWAKDFMGLETPGRVAMLGNMNDAQRNALRDNLKKINPDTGEQMFNNAMRLHFGEAALGKVDLESWKKSDLASQKNLAPYSDEVIDQILRSFPDDDSRAKWMLGLTPDNRTKAMGVMNSRFGTAEKVKYNKAERRQEMRGKELAGGDEFDKFVNALSADKDSDYLDSADDRQKLLWLESVTKIIDPAIRASKLNRYQEIVRTKLSPEDQEKLHRETMRRASMPAISSYINTLPDVASKEKVIGSASSAQQAQLWASDKTMRNTVDTAIGKQSADAQKDFHSALAREVERKTAGEIADVFVELPKETKRIVVQGNVDRNIEVIANLDKAGKSADAKDFAGNLKDAGLTTQYARRLNPAHKVQYIDGVDPTHPDFVEKVGNEIRNTSAKDLVLKLNTDILANKQLREALLKKGSLNQFANLAADTPNKQAIVKEMLTTDDAGNALAPGAILNNIKAKNKELGMQIEALREKEERALIPAVREFLESIFGKK